MYIQIHQDMECSKCGSINNTETVNRDMSTYIRCRSCGHEKTNSTLTVSNHLTGAPPAASVNYINSYKRPDKEMF